jgi:serine/threonine protein phosphatase PrpC
MATLSELAILRSSLCDMSESVLVLAIRPDIELANVSDVGCVREANEDYYVFIEPQDPIEFERRGRLVLVADGMGGCEGGRIASRIAGDTIRDVFSSSEEDDPLVVLKEGFRVAHERIQARATEDGVSGNMGTTCTAIILKRLAVTVGHIGDSRLYLIRNGQTEQLSHDHTLVNQLLADDLITKEEALTHEKKHVLSAALGVGSWDEASFFNLENDLQVCDILLLCSDGLHGLVSGEEMASVTADQSLEEACAELLAWARVRGGPDNITLQMIRIAEPAPQASEDEQT